MRTSYDNDVITSLLRVGAKLSNVVFNWGQRHNFTEPDYRLSKLDLKMLYDLSREWDAAALVARKDAKPVRKPRRKVVPNARH